MIRERKKRSGAIREARIAENKRPVNRLSLGIFIHTDAKVKQPVSPLARGKPSE